MYRLGGAQLSVDRIGIALGGGLNGSSSADSIAALGCGHGGVLVIQGAAGIGKSTLLRTVCEQAAGQQLQTLTAQASDLERDFGLGVVRRLLEARMIRAGKSEPAELLTGAAAG